MQNGATLHGRALGQKDVTLIANTIVSPTAPAASGDATLSRIDITPSAGTISPLIAPSVHNSINVPNTVTSTTVTPTASDAHTTITVNNVPVVSGVASASIPLDIGVNTITITTTAQDTTTLSYVILMYRAGLVGTSGGHSSSSVTSTNSTSGCSVGNLFSATTGQSCGITISSTTSEIQKVTQNLKFGTTSQDVRTLQLFLISQNKGPASLTLKITELQSTLEN